MAFCKKCGKELKKGETCSCEKEVKFCKYCGKKLVGDEQCDCEKSSNEATTTQFDFVATLKEIKDDLLKSLKKPVTVTKENVEQKNMPETYMLLVIIALTFGIFIASLCKNLIGLLISSMSGSLSSLVDMSDYIKIPYFKVIAFGTIIFAIMILAYALIMLLVKALFKNKEISFKDGLTLTVSAYMPLVFVNVICAILGFLNLNATVVLCIYMVCNMIVTYNFAYAYAKITNVNENKFGYVIATLVVLTSLIVGICTYTVSKNMTESLTEDMVDTSDVYDMFN